MIAGTYATYFTHVIKRGVLSILHRSRMGRTKESESRGLIRKDILSVTEENDCAAVGVVCAAWSASPRYGRLEWGAGITVVPGFVFARGGGQ